LINDAAKGGSSSFSINNASLPGKSNFSDGSGRRSDSFTGMADVGVGHIADLSRFGSPVVVGG
jgi:hypothetical protein